MKKFEAEDQQPRWARVYNGIRALKTGEAATYHQLSEWAGVDVTGTNRACVYEAIRFLQRKDHRTLACIPTVGYMVVPASAHEDLAKKHNKKAGRQLREAIGKVQSADRNYLTPAEARRMDSMEVDLSRQRHMIIGLSRRLDRTETAIKEARQRDREAKGTIAQLSEEKDALATEVRERLARLEQVLLDRTAA
jgi:hypothetical protein